MMWGGWYKSGENVRETWRETVKFEVVREVAFEEELGVLGWFFLRIGRKAFRGRRGWDCIKLLEKRFIAVNLSLRNCSGTMPVSAHKLRAGLVR